jgi:hypothetical protein
MADWSQSERRSARAASRSVRAASLAAASWSRRSARSAACSARAAVLAETSACVFFLVSALLSCLLFARDGFAA